MYKDKLFKKILIEPSKTCDRLEIVSGFASPKFLKFHLMELEKSLRSIELDLIIGIAKNQIHPIEHEKYCEFTENGKYGSKVTCRYVVKGKPVHAKSYCWFKDNKPTIAFLGSSNYSKNGFLETGYLEVMEKTDPEEISSFFKRILQDTKTCTDSNLDLSFIRKSINVADIVTGNTQLPDVLDLHDNLKSNLSLKVSLLIKKTGKTHESSGLNWGHGKNREKRNKNEAQLSLTKDLQDTGFFPEKGEFFKVITDDGIVMTMVRREKNGKGIHTPENNTILGKYIRQRLGLPSGEFVTRQHLDNYGRTDVLFTKINNQTYRMDFSVQSQ